MTRRLLGWLPFVLIAVGVAFLALNASHGASDNDLWWHLRLGYDFLQQGSLATPQHWSSLATASWVPTEPLPEVMMAKADQWAGFDGVMWLYGVGLIAVLVALYAGNRAVSSALPASVAALAGLMGCAMSLTPRPQLGSFVLLALVLRAWNRTSDDLQPRWYLIPLCYGWSLWHGFWFIGVAYGFLEIAGLLLDRRIRPSQARPLLAVAILSGASVLLNPIGPKLFEAPFVVNDVKAGVKEWDHTSLATPAAIAVLVMLIAVAALWLTDRRLWTWRGFLLLLSAVFWSWYAWRTLALAAVILAPLLARGLDALLVRSGPAGDDSAMLSPLSSRREAGLLAGWVLVVLVGLGAILPVTAHQQDPDTAVDRRLDRLPAGSVVLNQYDVGGWLAWRHPDLNRAIDGLITPYSPEYVDRYFHARSADPGWQQFVSDIDPQAALLWADSRLTRALEAAGWVETARTNDYVLLMPHAKTSG